MSLVVWLPLNGNLNNQGLSDVTVTSTSTTVDANGKIGSCMKVVDAVGLNYAPDFGTGSFSFCGWFKFNKSEIATKVSTLTINATYKQPTGNLIGNNSYGGIGITWNANNVYADGAFNSMSIMGTIRTSTISARNTGSFAVSFDTWIHIALLWDYEAKKLSIYKDGIHHASTTTPDFSDAVIRSLNINYPGVWSGNGPQAEIPFRANDIRVYDHCLSDKEVKEIAKGLCLHYSFAHNVFDNEFLVLEDGTKWRKLLHHNNPSKNLFTQSNYKNVNTQDLYSKLYLLDTSSNFLLSNGTYEFLIKEKSLATSTEYWYRWSQTSDPGSSSSITGFTSIQNDTNSGYVIGLKKDQSAHGYMHNGNSWWVCCGCFTAFNGGIPGAGATVTTGYLDLYVRYESLNYEVGDPIYDDSGFRNDGSIYSATSISISDKFDAPRYKECLNVQGSGSWINAPCPRLSNFSYSFWFKRSRASQSQREMLCTGWYGISFELNTNNTLTFREAMTTSHTAKDVISTMTFTTGVWYHVVCTHQDGVESKMYINGELHKTVALTDPIDYTTYSMQIATYSAATYQFNGQLSDFRVYASVLSASDIKELYNVGGTIDNKGNLFSYELDEN